MNFIDLDDFMNKAKNVINKILKQKGEIYFRKIEHQY